MNLLIKKMMAILKLIYFLFKAVVSKKEDILIKYMLGYYSNDISHVK